MLFEIVKKAIDERNLYGLLNEAPSNEFDDESRKIAEIINNKSTTEEIAQAICEVFSKAFDDNFKAVDFIKTAEKIFKAMQDN